MSRIYNPHVLKAFTSDVNAALATKASTTSVNAALALKAFTSDVNTALASKAFTSDVNAALATKANDEATTLALATKASTTSVNMALATKADINGQTFSGPISATNLNGSNSGDQTNISGSAGSAAIYSGANSSLPTAKLASDNGITGGMIGDRAIGQGELKTTSGEVSSSTGLTLTLPGGAYGFYPRIRSSHTFAGTEVTAKISKPDGGNAAPGSFTTKIYIAAESTATGFAQQTYIQASPPYDLGDGEIPLFIFCEIDSQGTIVSAYEAPEAPWHYNGPTDIRASRYAKDGRAYKNMKDAIEIDKSLQAAGLPKGTTIASAKKLSISAYVDYIYAFASAKNEEIEITQAIKNADMALIPTPMQSVKNDIVMLDPVSDLTFKLAKMKEHDEFSILDLLHNGDLIVDNIQSIRAGPPNVKIMGYKFR